MQKRGIRNSWYLTAVALLCLAPGALASPNIHDSGKNKTCKHNRDCTVAAAEGGSAGWYLLLAGMSCFGAMAVGSRAKQLRGEKTV